MLINPHQDAHSIQPIKGSFIAGRIIKGTISQASTKLRVASIPNKHQNIIYATNSTTGFGASHRHGLQSFTNQTPQPGPGFYNAGEGQKKPQSKKGNGFFASQTKLATLKRFKSEALGPGSYETKDPEKKVGRDRHKNYSQSIGHQLFKKELQVSLFKPGVGSYNLNVNAINRNNSLPAFKSKINRFQQETQKSPPVGLYEPTQFNFNKKIKKNQEQLIKKEEFEKENQRHKLIEKAIKSVVNTDRAKDNLGPGSYNPSFAAITKTFKMSDNMYDRFGQLKPIFQMAKSIQSDNKISGVAGVVTQNEKKPDAAFKSNTKKWEIEVKNQMDPGRYNSNKSPTKVSHLINFTKKWV